MKTLILIPVFFTIPFLVQAQWVDPGNDGTGNIYYNNGNVGIGSESSPGNYRLYIKQPASAPQYGVRLVNADDTKSMQFWLGTGGGVIDAEGTTNLHLRTAGVDRIFVDNGGKVGIGTITPNAMVDVVASGISPGTSGLAINNTFATQSGDHSQNRPFTIRRNQSDSEALFTFLQDGGLHFVYQNDESSNQIFFRLINTDTETGGGANANDNIVMRLFGNQNGNGVCIGTNDYNSAYKLSVGGKIRATEIKVENVPQSDYVFEPDYRLLPLSEVETHIKEKKHLPGIPSAEEFKQNGVGLGEMDDMLLRKVEELVLYVIEQQKELEELKRANEELRRKNEQQDEKIQSLINDSK